MKATTTYECHCCDNIVKPGDDVFLVGGDLRCTECVKRVTD